MSSLARTNWVEPAPRTDDNDNELAQRIALALRSRKPTLDAEPRLAGHYALESRLAGDNYVERFGATRVSDGRRVQIEMPFHDPHPDHVARERFTRRARQQCRLRHPSAIATLAYGVGSDGRPYLVRAALDTESLETVLAREGGVSWPRARSIVIQLCDAITAARKLGLVPADLSLQGCHRVEPGKAVADVRDGVEGDIRIDVHDDVRIADWMLLEGRAPLERDERIHVAAIGRILEALASSRCDDGTQGHVMPAELRGVLARSRGVGTTAPYATVDNLRNAIASISDAVPTAQSVVVVEAPTRRRRVLWPWIGLGLFAGVGALHLAVPSLLPGIVDQARGGIESLRGVFAEPPPMEAPAPIATLTPASMTPTDLPPSELAIAATAIPVAPAVAQHVVSPSYEVPPAPTPSAARAAAMKIKAKAKATMNDEVIPQPVDRARAIAATPPVTPVDADTPEPTAPVPVPEPAPEPMKDPPPTAPPQSDPPASDPPATDPTPSDPSPSDAPVNDPPREIDVPTPSNALPSVEGEAK